MRSETGVNPSVASDTFTWSFPSGLVVPMPMLPEAARYREPAGAARFAVKPALFPAVKPPRKVEVAVVEVAKKFAAVGVEDETMAPEAEVVSIMFAPVAEPESVNEDVAVIDGRVSE